MVNHMHEIVKQIVCIMRTRSRIRVKLNGKCRVALVTQTFDRIIVDFTVSNDEFIRID